MKLHYYLLFICVLIFSSCKKPDTRSAMNNSDHNFLIQASHFNRSQIEISNLSCLKTGDLSIKQLAVRLVKYHQQSQHEIEHIALDNHTNIPTQHNQKRVNMRNSLSQLSGKAFDSVYVCYQLKLNLTMLNLINDEMHYGKNEALKKYASRINSQVLAHLNQSDSLSQQFLTTYFRKEI